MPVTNGEEKMLFPQAGMKPGLQIWRIENFQPVKVDLPDDSKKPSMKFHKGDSYIILQTIHPKSQANIYFWLGPDSSQDETGTAAQLAVVLDDELDGYPVQHRVVGGKEDEQFKSLFKTMSYLEGGHKTAFKEGKKTFKTALLQVKGRKNVYASEVPLSIDSLNHGDCFVLDCGRKIYVWIGKGSNKKEKLNAFRYAQELRDEERAGLAVVSFTNTQEEKEEFFLLLTGQKRIVQITKEGKSDEVHDENTAVSLFRVHEDATGNIAMKETGSKPLKREDLDSDDTFILETGGSVYVWQGKKSSRKEKNKLFKDADGFLTARNRKTSTPIKVIKEDLEPTEFKQFFCPWERVTAYGETITSSAGSITSKEKIEKKFGKFEVKTMHAKRGVFSSLPDDGKGTVEVWRICNFEKQPVTSVHDMVFYSGDCYVILYTYKKNNNNSREHRIIYFWLGNDSTSDEQGKAASVAIEFDDKYGGEPYQVRVCEGKEPLHFIMIFNYHLVICQGGHASGYANLKTERHTAGASSNVRLLQVRVTQMKTSTTSVPVHRVVEVAPFTQSLNSSDVFILWNNGKCFIWVGKGSIGDEKECANEVVGRMYKGIEVGVISEGNEDNSFWKILGGKADYASAKQIWNEEESESYEARLFLCSNASGRFVCEEIYDFSQEDLEEDDVMILDAWTQLFIWVGDTARKEEKEEAIKTALEYVKTDTRKRDKSKIPMSVVKQGKEPAEFKYYFIAWEPQMWNKKMSYEDRIKAIKQDNEKVDQSALTWAEWNERLKPKSYSLEVLQKKGEELPEDVDVTSKEMHLEDTEFQEHFRMSKKEWERVPKWKKAQRKKELDLF